MDVLPGWRCRQVRHQRQEDPQERPRYDCQELRLRLCGAGGYGRQPGPVLQRHQRGRGLPRPVAHHLLRTLHQPRHQDWYGPHAERGEESRRVRLLAPLALQPRRGRGRQERLPPRLEVARLEQVPRLHYGRSSLQLLDEDLLRRS